ncbi:hypothetical protein RF11_06808 [Thelohanellus kitauei]|uniref:Uncharacterized protein n=1 Tax=Thelohanellus kitauei TaxID=669202 RepID=A0A0C2MMA1_THEKT|nr:hypothetical protein RF11_06808 [Thelohanellus kitauei]
MEDDQKLHDLWQKCDILLKNKNIDLVDDLMLNTLKFVTLEQTFVRDETLCVKYEDIYRKTFDEYCNSFQKNIDFNDLDFTIKFDAPELNQPSIAQKYETDVVEVVEENVDNEPNAVYSTII